MTEFEKLKAEIVALTHDRETAFKNRRVNDAIQTAFERGELGLCSEGWLLALKAGGA